MNQHPLMKYFGPEDWHAKAVADHLKLFYPKLMWWHTPNEGRRTGMDKLRMTTHGIRSGVSDILVISDRPEKKGLCLELKAGRNTTSANQKTFLNDMEACGWTTAVTYDAKESIKLLNEWILDNCTIEVCVGGYQIAHNPFKKPRQQKL